MSRPSAQGPLRKPPESRTRSSSLHVTSSGRPLPGIVPSSPWVFISRSTRPSITRRVRSSGVPACPSAIASVLFCEVAPVVVVDSPVSPRAIRSCPHIPLVASEVVGLFGPPVRENRLVDLLRVVMCVPLVVSGTAALRLPPAA